MPAAGGTPLGACLGDARALEDPRDATRPNAAAARSRLRAGGKCPDRDGGASRGGPGSISTRLRVAAAGRCETDDGTRRLCAQIFCMGRAVLCTGYVWWPLASRPAGPRTRWSLVGRKPGMDKISSGRE